MKKIISLLISLSCLVSYSQSDNAIYYNDIKINGNPFPQTQASFENLFGTPNSIGNYYNELSNENWTELKYNSNSFYFDNDKLIEFQIKDNSCSFYDQSIKVGNPISSTQIFFPLSYQGRSVSVGKGFVTVNLMMDNGALSDNFVTITYNPIDNLITEINLGTF